MLKSLLENLGLKWLSRGATSCPSSVSVKFVGRVGLCEMGIGLADIGSRVC